eukprot:m.176516 g.176516  ORF g.176516 m.176516 type:complete len:633 (-) comp16801_c0_seq1:1596-3494(-)
MPFTAQLSLLLLLCSLLQTVGQRIPPPEPFVRDLITVNESLLSPNVVSITDDASQLCQRRAVLTTNLVISCTWVPSPSVDKCGTPSLGNVSLLSVNTTVHGLPVWHHVQLLAQHTDCHQLEGDGIDTVLLMGRLGNRSSTPWMHILRFSPTAAAPHAIEWRSFDMGWAPQPTVSIALVPRLYCVVELTTDLQLKLRLLRDTGRNLSVWSDMLTKGPYFQPVVTAGDQIFTLTWQGASNLLYFHVSQADCPSLHSVPLEAGYQVQSLGVPSIAMDSQGITAVLVNAVDPKHRVLLRALFSNPQHPSLLVYPVPCWEWGCIASADPLYLFKLGEDALLLAAAGQVGVVTAWDSPSDVELRVINTSLTCFEQVWLQRVDSNGPTGFSLHCSQTLEWFALPVEPLPRSTGNLSLCYQSSNIEVITNSSTRVASKTTTTMPTTALPTTVAATTTSMTTSSSIKIATSSAASSTSTTSTTTVPATNVSKPTSEPFSHSTARVDNHVSSSFSSFSSSTTDGSGVYFSSTAPSHTSTGATSTVAGSAPPEQPSQSTSPTNPYSLPAASTTHPLLNTVSTPKQQHLTELIIGALLALVVVGAVVVVLRARRLRVVLDDGDIHGGHDVELFKMEPDDDCLEA